MKKISFSLLLLLTISFATAQITTTNWLFQFDEFKNTYGKKEGQLRNTTIKMLNVEYFENTENLFGTHLFNQIKNDKVTVYKDIACTQPYQESEMKAFYAQLKGVNLDTVIVFDPKTSKEEERIVRWETELFPSKDIGYRVKQDWNFDQNAQKLSSTIQNLTITDIKKTNPQQYFSVKVTDGDKAVTKADLKNDDFILIQRIEYIANFTGKEMGKYLLTDEHFKKNKLYSRNKEINIDEVHLALAFEGSIDTIVTFDPETFAEEIKIVKLDAVSKSDFRNYKILQDFYLDPINRIIKNKIIAIAPLHPTKNKFGNYLTGFWIVYDEDAFLKRKN